MPLAPLIRLMFQQTIAILQRAEPKKEKGESFPVLFLLDEFVSLGRMEVLSSAITTLRSYGGRVMIVVQTIASLRDLYGKEGASNFLANCRMQLFMAPADEETPNYISNAVGDYTRKLRSKSWKSGEFTTSIQERVDASRLMRPEQVRMLGGTRIVALVQNMYPILAHRVTYYQDRELKRIFEAQTGDLPEPPSLVDEDHLSEQIGAGSDLQLRSGQGGEAVGSARRSRREPASPSSRSTDDTDDATEQKVYSDLGEVKADQVGVLGAIAKELAEAATRNRKRIAVKPQEVDERTVESEACSAKGASAKKSRKAALPTDPPADHGLDLSDVLRDAQRANRVRSDV